jgi:hypothetical protein
VTGKQAIPSPWTRPRSRWVAIKSGSGSPLQAARTAGPPKGVDAPMNHAKRTTRRGRSTPGTDRWLSRQPVGAKGLPQSKHGHLLNALTCSFAPLAGLEPATYGLEVRHEPSAW